MAVPLNHKNHSHRRSGKTSEDDFTSHYESKGFKVIKDTYALSTDGQKLYHVNPKASGVLTVPNGVTSIEYRAFSGCILSAIVFPRSLQCIGEEPFTSCVVRVIVFKSSPSLPQELFSYWQPDEVIVNDKNDIQRIKDRSRNKFCRVVHKSDKWNYYRTTSFYSDFSKAYEDKFGVMYSHDGKILLRFNKRLHRYEIPDGVDTIAQGAFEGSHIKEVTMPRSMRVIGSGAFSSCKNLKSVTFNSGLKHIFDRAFNGCELLTDVKLPESLLSIGGFAGCVSLASVSLPSTLKEIPNSAFMNTLLDTIEIPDCVERIGFNAFQSTNLKSIILPRSLRTIEAWGFSRCNYINTVTLPEGIDTIPRELFADCKNLKSVIALGQIKEIEGAAFKGCSSLEHITIPQQDEIGSNTFQDCTSLKSIVVPYTVRYIRQGAFLGCTSLESLKLLEGLEVIESNIISSTKISELSIPSTVRLIGGKAFAGAHYLTKVIFTGVTSIFDNVFDDCPNLKEIHIPRGLKSQFVESLKTTSASIIED